MEQLRTYSSENGLLDSNVSKLVAHQHRGAFPARVVQFPRAIKVPIDHRQFRRRHAEATEAPFYGPRNDSL